MNKTAIKNFAVWARNKLIADITYRAGLMGIAWDGIKSALPQSTKDTEFYDIGTKEPYSITGEAVRQRRRLTELIDQKTQSSDYKTAYRSVLEEVAYTWFNRLIAIRFMEVNDYLPSRIRVLSSESRGKLEPDLVTTPFDAELELTAAEKETVMRLKTDNQVDGLFRLLFVKQCNALNKVLPKLFEKTADDTELLLNISVTDQDGVVYHLVHDIDEDDFNIKKGGQVEIIGWLYQYYNTELNEQVYDGNMSKSRIVKELLPAATTIYTPDWAVQYMVQNSLGKLWIDGHPDDDLKVGWKYYLDEAEQEADVEAQLVKLREEYKTIQPAGIKVIDPCMGSGHILVYAFDVLMQIYEAAGYTQREAAGSILENNLYGLDIDDRAFQLAYFAMMMKARQYNRRILNGETDCHVYSIQESNTVNRNHLKYLGAGMDKLERNNALNQLTGLLDTFVDAKEYGSILNVDACDWDLLHRFVAQSSEGGQMTMDSLRLDETKEQLRVLVDIGQALAQKYDVVVTNPPYLGSSRFSPMLDKYVKDNYADVKSDLSMVMYKHAVDTMVARNGYVTFITTSSWMFLSSFEKLRSHISNVASISSLVDFGTELFDGKVGHNPIVSWVTRKLHVDYKMVAIRLVDYCFSRRDEKEFEFFNVKNRYTAQQSNFSKIPGSPIAYWMSRAVFNAFDLNKKIGQLAEPKQGSTLGDNASFLRFWFEIGDKGNKWYNCMKGGEYRRWYGNQLYVLDWEDNGTHVRSTGRATIRSADRLFEEGITWSNITSGKSSFRYMPSGFFFESTGSVCFSSPNLLKYLLAFLNTPIAEKLNRMINPTLHLQSGDVAKLPLKVAACKVSEISEYVDICIKSAKNDWDSFETSWDFQRHPLVTAGRETGGLIERHFAAWSQECEGRFTALKANEQQLNRIFIDMYDLQDELSPEVEDKDVTVRRADLGRDIRSLISYAVGCMFGRYSLDVDGLAYAGGEWDDGKYSSFIPDKDNILPITDEEYFPDDIVGLFCAWLKKVYGEDTLETNLDFIAGALGNKGNTSREIIRSYFLNDFIKDHIKTYQKRPIYWLFDSGKQNGFKALVYMHRYEENTIGNLRIDYLHRMESVYDNEVARMQDIIDNSEVAREVAQATKRREKLQKQLKECKEYDERIAHLALARIPIDLDDGVKVNYEKVQTVDGIKYPILATI